MTERAASREQPRRPEDLAETVHREPNGVAREPCAGSPGGSLPFPHNLPSQLTSFVGRESELTEVRRLLGETRLVTPTGPGGCGKTRLALRVAAEVLEDFRDGVWLVELAALTNPTLVPPAVASVLAIREQPARSLLATLADFCRSKRLLLALDNCEHLVAACAELADSLLRACPQLRILATSREALGIAGETSWPVPSLARPNPLNLPAVEILIRYEAIRLFVERATAVQPTFRLTDQNAAATAQVCDRLDGLPLAIELAAVWVKTLAVEQIAARLDERFRLLTKGSRTALPRQQTLRATVDWSYDLLNEAERRLLNRLSAYAGGWSLEAAEAVGAGEGIDALDVLDLLAQLVDKSLVVVDEPEGEARYRLLETLRLYSAEKLAGAGEEAKVRRRHRNWFLELVERVEPSLWGPDQAAALHRLEIEHENLRRALEWSATDRDSAAAGLRLAGTLWRFWWLRGHYTEGRGWLAATLARAPERTATRAKALDGAGWLALVQEDVAAADPLLRESLAIAREVGDRRVVAWALTHLGFLAYRQGDYQAARAQGEESLALARELDDRWALAWSLHLLGRVAQLQRDNAAALALYEESLAVRRQVGDHHGIANSLFLLGRMALGRGDLAAARRLLEECLGIARAVGDRWTLGHATGLLGLMAHNQGDFATAHARYEECLTLAQELGDRQAAMQALTGLGVLALEQGDPTTARARFDEGLSIAREAADRFSILQLLAGSAILAATEGRPERALHLAGAVTALAEAFKLSFLPGVPARLNRGAQRVRSAVSGAVAEAAWEAGRTMTLDQAIAYALANEPGAGEPPVEEAEADRPPPPSEPRTETYPAGLTPREIEVLRLLAAGQTSRDIAADLVVSVATVHRHSSNVYGKIGARGRADATAYALTHGVVPARRS